MEKEFKYHKSYYLLFLISAPFLYLIVKGFVYEFRFTGNWMYTLLTISILLFLFILLIRRWYHFQTVVKTTPEKIIIRRPFKTIQLRWNDIFEVGKFKKLGFKRYYWCFYIKGREIDAEKIIFATEDIGELKSLIALIFHKAQNAKFVAIQNAPLFIFLNKKVKTSWDKNEDLEQYGHAFNEPY